MQDITSKNFGILISYVLPGFVTLWALEPFSEIVRSWVSQPPWGAASVGGFLHVTVASLFLGLVIDVVRWAVLDGLHHRTGIPAVEVDFSEFNEKRIGFEGIVANHYDYYLFYSNSVVALTILACAMAITGQWSFGIYLALAGVIVGFWRASRDALRKTYRRGSQLLGSKGDRG